MKKLTAICIITEMRMQMCMRMRFVMPCPSGSPLKDVR